MIDLPEQKEDKFQDLMELHHHLIAQEKIEIASHRLCYSKERIIEEYQIFFDHNKDHIALIQEGKIKHLSPSIATLLGYSKNHLIGDHFASYVLPEEIPKVAQIYRNRLAGKKAPIVYSTLLRHRSGKSIPIKIIASLSTYLGESANFAIIKELSLGQDAN